MQRMRHCNQARTAEWESGANRRNCVNARKPAQIPAASGSPCRVLLSKLGYCSRTQAERLIADGRVAVDGRIVRNLDAWVDLQSAKLAVDGATIAAEAKIYLMLNKPRGLLTTRHDPEERPTVYDCLKEFDIPHLSPVGRLDKASEGLLLFTNDTEFAQALLDPITHVTKTYHVQVNRIMDARIAGRNDIRDPARRRSADSNGRTTPAERRPQLLDRGRTRRRP